MGRLALNLEGKTFGKLLVLKRSSRTDKHKQVYWECECQCENKTIITATTTNLVNNVHFSCGCIRRQVVIKDREQAIWNHIYTEHIKNQSQKKNFKEYLNIDSFKEIASKPCFYCGKSPSLIRKDKSYFRSRKEKKEVLFSDNIVRYNGLDRIDNNKGYLKDNVVSCCQICNDWKSNFTQEEFSQRIIEIYQHCNLDQRNSKNSAIFINIDPENKFYINNNHQIKTTLTI